MLSLRYLLVSVAYIALGTATMNLQSRGWVSALSLATVLAILYAFLAVFVGHPISRPFWIGFATFGFGWLYLHGAHPGREFYSTPAVLTEYLAGPDDVYHGWSSYHDPRYDGLTGPTYPDKRRTANRKRLRYIANCLTSIALGTVGGMIGVGLSRRTSRER